MGNRFEGKAAFITGASSGIGAAVAKELARQGARVAIAARRLDRLTEVADAIRGAGGEALPVACDVTYRASVEMAVNTAAEHFGGLDIVLANAGFYVDGIVQQLEPDDYRRQMETNFFGALHTVYAALPHLEKSRGRLGIVSSVMGLMAMPAASAYCASKYALCGFGECIHYDLAPVGISVTMVNPGLVESEIRSINNRQEHTGKPDPAPQAFVMPVEKAARKIAHALHRRKPQLILTKAARLGDFLNRHCPRLTRLAYRMTGRKKVLKRLARARRKAAETAG
jgi:NAD(P)-dependent dehydrogenase (short-subunit alcohol dehydrogenase family)